MDKQLSSFFIKNGYRPAMMPTAGYSLFLKNEAGMAVMVLLCDLTENPYITKEALKDTLNKCKWRLADQGINESHNLTIITANEIGTAMNVAGEGSFLWVYDPVNRELTVPEGRVEDFYGIRDDLSVWVKTDHPENEETVRYTVSGRKVLGFKEQPLVNHAIFLANILIFTFCTFTGDLVYNMGELSYNEVISGQWYRMITATFLHADISHLVGNMIMLFYIGNLVEKEMGHLRYFVLYFLSGICASAFSLYYQGMRISSGDIPGASIGASGAVFGVMAAFLFILFRKRGKVGQISFGGVLFLICYALYGGLTGTRTDNAAHIGGLIAGFILGAILYRMKGKQ